MPRIALAFTIALTLSLPVRARSADIGPCASSVQESFMNADVRVFGKGLKIVEGLQPRNFAVKINGVPQTVCKVDLSASPLSVGILLDSSASMVGQTTSLFGSVAAALKQLLDSSTAQDEYFLEYVTAAPATPPQFTSDISRIRAGLLTKPKGRTALIDSVCLALAAMKNARHPRRVLLILSDGLDNESKHNFKDLTRAFDEARVPIFMLLPLETWPGASKPTPDEQSTRNHLVEFVNQSGGMSVAAKGPREISEKIAKLAVLVREPYSLVLPQPQKPVSQNDRLDLRINVIGLDHPVQTLYRSVQIWNLKTASDERR